MSANSEMTPATLDVRVTNWPVDTKNAYANGIARSTFKTYILDATGVAGPLYAQICDMEPNRKRLVIISNDADIQVTLEVPPNAPDGTTATLAGQGAYLPKSTVEREFFGPDAMWIKSITGATAGRVTVIKEYC